MNDTCTIFVRDLKMNVRAGIHPQEKKGRQPVRFQLEVTYARSGKKGGKEKIDDIMCYGEAVGTIKKTVNARHYDLLETMADDILDALAKDKRARSMKLTIEKLKPYAPDKSLLTGVGSLGVIMERRRK
jgi:dihydroneopterin aldolase